MVKSRETELDAKLRQTKQSIREALKDRPKPSMSLDELRRLLDEEMGEKLLSDFVIEQRQR